MATFADVLKTLNVRPVFGADENIESSDKVSGKSLTNVFEGSNIYLPTRRTYGGQLMAQALIAAAKTVSEYRLPNSFHCYFMKPGLLSSDLFFEVERLNDGAKYSHREVTVTQDQSKGRAIFKSLISFHEGENLEATLMRTPKMPKVPVPSKVKSMEEIFEPIEATLIGKKSSPNEWVSYFAHQQPLEVHQVYPSLFLEPDSKGHDEVVWVRIRPSDAGALLDIQNPMKRQLFQRALLAFACDQFAFSPALRGSGLSWTIPSAAYASLDHAMYFHEDVDLTDWVLLYGTSPSVANGRGLGTYTVFNAAGSVVASFTQEGTIRL